jgi:hypothetical protein
VAVKGIAPAEASIGAAPERLQGIGPAVAEELGDGLVEELDI